MSKNKIFVFSTFSNSISRIKQIEPDIVGKYCSKHPDVFEISLDLLLRKVRMLIEYNVHPENILRDLHILARSEESMIERLTYLQKHQVERVMPWMIKCEMHVINR